MSETTDLANRTLEFKRGEFEPITCEFQGEVTADCQKNLARAFEYLDEAIGDVLFERCAGLHIKIGDNLTDGGGEAKAKDNLVVLDYNKMSMSLQESEDLLVREGWFNKDERARTLPEIKDEPWSTLVYDAIHEVGHIFDERSPGDKNNRLNLSISPTKYGKEKANEAFPEAFTYFVLKQPLDPEALKAVMRTISKD